MNIKSISKTYFTKQTGNTFSTMKLIKSFLIIILMGNIAFAQNKTVTHDSLLLESKVYLLKSSRLPFTGTAISYNNGQKVIETQYINGKVDGVEILYFNNGNIETESHYTEGKFNGIMKNYYSDGSLKSEEMYENDYKNGKSTCFFTFNRKEKEGNYEDCIELGIWTFWDENGRKIAEIDYRDGEVVREVKY